MGLGLAIVVGIFIRGGICKIGLVISYVFVFGVWCGFCLIWFCLVWFLFDFSFCLVWVFWFCFDVSVVGFCLVKVGGFGTCQGVYSIHHSVND